MDALRHGWPIAMAGGPVLLPVETAIAAQAQSGTMLITAARAATLNLANQRAAAYASSHVASHSGPQTHMPVLIRRAEPFDLQTALPIADPALDLATPLKGPFKAQTLEWTETAVAALELARIAGILPAFLVDAANAGEAESVAAGDLDDWRDVARLAIATHAHLPVAASPDARIVAFRSADDMREHIALVFGNQCAERTPLVRLHSECLTGDILGSLKCDCGPQLHTAMEAMAAEARNGGWGILLYLRQEGRGIGLVNKLRAYSLQDQGFDTVDANRRLGLPDEARDFQVAARMLDLLNAGAIRLMTNNPAKVDALTGAGIAVAQRVPHQMADNPHNRDYLQTKRDRSGHILP